MKSASKDADAVDCFDIEKVSEKMKRSLLDVDDVRIKDYLEAYEEIMKFFLLMGSVFSFVSSDVRNKLDILNDLQNQDTKEHKHFDSVKTMLIYEKNASLLQQKGYVSGSRTFLRLHRGLEFVYEFLTRLLDVGDDEKTHSVCKSAYNDTLAKYHPFLIRKGAQVAMFAMPTRGDLLKRICQNVDVSRTIEKLPEMLQHMRVAYDRTDKIFTLQDLQSLP